LPNGISLLGLINDFEGDPSTVFQYVSKRNRKLKIRRIFGIDISCMSYAMFMRHDSVAT